MEGRSGYVCGVSLGAVLLCLLYASLIETPTNMKAGDPSKGLVFDPSRCSIIEPWILPGARREVATSLVNSSGKSITIDGIELSHAWATAELNEGVKLPFNLAHGRSLTVKIAVTAEEIAGTEVLRFVARGRQGDTHIQAKGTVDLRFVGRINAEPLIVPLGEVHRAHPIIERRVRLWSPKELGIQKLDLQDIFAISSDPCVHANMKQEESTEKATGDAIDGRVDCGCLVLRIDPAKAPGRINVTVTVSSAGSRAVIRVIGFTSESPAVH